MAPILIVDDHPTMRLLLQSILGREGYTLYTAEHGAAGLELLKAHPDIKLLVTDLDMPVMGGLELLSKVCPPVFKVIVSAHLVEAASLERYGVSAHFEKPLDIRRFTSTVRALLDSQPVAGTF